MDQSSKIILRAAGEIIKQVRIEERKILEIAEDPERSTLREEIFDLEKASSHLNRALSR